MCPVKLRRLAMEKGTGERNKGRNILVHPECPSN